MCHHLDPRALSDFYFHLMLMANILFFLRGRSLVAFPFYFLIKKILLFLSAQRLCCCLWAFSSCSEQGLLSGCSALASH